MAKGVNVSVFGYIRVSTDEQDKSGLGLESQKSKIISYCDLYNLELIDIFHDARSGKNLNRPGLKNILSRLNQNESGIVISKLDRLTRSVKDMGTLLEGYFIKKYTLHVVDEKIDTGTASGIMMVNILMSVAQWERETISERTRAALQVKKDRGEKTGGLIPYGYDCKNGVLFENIYEKYIINDILNLKNIGYSFQKIADQLNDAGHKTKTNKKWQWHSIRKIYMKGKLND